MESSTEVELGGFFESCHKATFARMDLAEMGHQQQPTLVAPGNTEANSIVKGTEKQFFFINRHEVLLGQRQNPKNLFPHILEIGKEKLGRICKKIPDMAP